MDPHSKKLIRAISKLDLQGRENSYLQVYDIESEVGQEIPVNLRFLSLTNMSQINHNNDLYLCGSNAEAIEEDHTGSFFIKIDPSKTPVNMSYLVNSSHTHKFPAIVNYKNDYIIVVGGKDSVKCEVFNKKASRWKDLPDLPEVR